MTANFELQAKQTANGRICARARSAAGNGDVAAEPRRGGWSLEGGKARETSGTPGKHRHAERVPT